MFIYFLIYNHEIISTSATHLDILMMGFTVLVDESKKFLVLLQICTYAFESVKFKAGLTIISHSFYFILFGYSFFIYLTVFPVYFANSSISPSVFLGLPLFLLRHLPVFIIFFTSISGAVLDMCSYHFTCLSSICCHCFLFCPFSYAFIPYPIIYCFSSLSRLFMPPFFLLCLCLLGLS